ncbi:hypothetical protein [Acinetobacter pittii]|uniref:hypothetical protein n=1 Tax=Acinetobacter pittii TaxID=48296 RepID=UPI000837AB76|nr:hypothetical protein [Acinetobacter pittii]MCK0915093.1 hypothetical protein [Acinetobacter pittii]
MVDIIVKDKLRASIEAASGGRQTVLYTAKGQPTYMNIVEQFSNDIYGGVDGMGSYHPMFNFSPNALDRIFIGTYKGVVVNGELLSLPYENLGDGRMSMKDTMNAARACGRGFHQMTYVQHSGLVNMGIAKGGFNRGNQDQGLDTIGHAGVKGTFVDGMGQSTKNGSGGYTWTHDGTIHGIHDLSGGGWQFATGLRIVGKELQIQGNNYAYNYASADDSLGNDWWAIDATTGGFIVPSSTGTLETDTFLNTTPNSIRIESNEASIGNESIYIPMWYPWVLSNFKFGAGISEFCKAQLKTFGVIPVSNVNTDNTAYLSIQDDNPYRVRYFMRGGAVDTGAASGGYSTAALVVDANFTLASNYGRPCFAEI